MYNTCVGTLLCVGNDINVLQRVYVFCVHFNIR